MLLLYISKKKLSKVAMSFTSKNQQTYKKQFEFSENINFTSLQKVYKKISTFVT